SIERVPPRPSCPRCVLGARQLLAHLLSHGTYARQLDAQAQQVHSSRQPPADRRYGKEGEPRPDRGGPDGSGDRDGGRECQEGSEEHRRGEEDPSLQDSDVRCSLRPCDSTLDDEGRVPEAGLPEPLTEDDLPVADDPELAARSRVDSTRVEGARV